MRVLSLVSAGMLVPALAFAHETGVPHVHPHGADVLIMGLALVALAIGGYKVGLFSPARQDHRNRK